MSDPEDDETETFGDDAAVPCPHCGKPQCLSDPIAEGYGVGSWESSDCDWCEKTFEWMAEYSVEVTARIPVAADGSVVSPLPEPEHE